MSDPDVYRRLAALEKWRDQMASVEVPSITQGTWVPTYIGNTIAGTTTYTLQSGSYVRIARAVLFTMTVVWTAATGTGLALYSLPLPVSSTADQYFAATCRSSGITFGAGAPEVEIDNGTQQAYLRYPTSDAATSDINVEAAGNVIISGWYLTT